MKSAKRLFLSLLLVGGFFSSNAAHAGIPTFDITNLAEAAKQVAAWVKQYAQMTDQLQQAKQQYDSMTGSRGLGDILNNPLLKEVVPADMASVYSAIGQSGNAGLTSAAQAIRAANKIYNCEDRTGDAQKSCEALLSMNAQTQAYQQNALALTMQRGQQIQSLQSQINTTGDMKAVAELQARIQSENAQVANDANRLAIMKAMAEAQQQANEQASRERVMKMLATNAPKAADTFHYAPPAKSAHAPD